MNEILSNLARPLALAAGFAISLWVAPPWRRRGLVLAVALLLPLAGCGPNNTELEIANRLVSQAQQMCWESGGLPSSHLGTTAFWEQGLWVDCNEIGTSRPAPPPQPCPCVEKFRPGSWVCPGEGETVQLEEVPR